VQIYGGVFFKDAADGWQASNALNSVIYTLQVYNLKIIEIYDPQRTEYSGIATNFVSIKILTVAKQKRLKQILFIKNILKS
jgi:hypothetical protein